MFFSRIEICVVMWACKVFVVSWQSISAEVGEYQQSNAPFPLVKKPGLTRWSGVCVQWECVHSPVTSRSINSAVEAGFSHFGSAVNVNPPNSGNSQCLFLLFFFWCVMSSRRRAGFQFLMDFTITEVHINSHRAENDSCLTCVSIHTERFCWDELKLTAQCAALSLIKGQPRSPSTPLSLSLWSI